MGVLGVLTQRPKDWSTLVTRNLTIFLFLLFLGLPAEAQREPCRSASPSRATCARSVRACPPPRRNRSRRFSNRGSFLRGFNNGRFGPCSQVLRPSRNPAFNVGRGGFLPGFNDGRRANFFNNFGVLHFARYGRPNLFPSSRSFETRRRRGGRLLSYGSSSLTVDPHSTTIHSNRAILKDYLASNNYKGGFSLEDPAAPGSRWVLGFDGTPSYQVDGETVTCTASFKGTLGDDPTVHNVKVKFTMSFEQVDLVEIMEVNGNLRHRDFRS